MGDNIEQKSTEVKTEKKKPGPKPKATKEAEALTQAVETVEAVEAKSEEIKLDNTNLEDSQDTVEKTEEVEPVDVESTVVEDVVEKFEADGLNTVTHSTDLIYSSVVPFIFYRGPHDSLGDGYATDVLLTGEVLDGFACCELLAPKWISARGYVKLNDEIKHLLRI